MYTSTFTHSSPGRSRRDRDRHLHLHPGKVSGIPAGNLFYPTMKIASALLLVSLLATTGHRVSGAPAAEAADGRSLIFPSYQNLCRMFTVLSSPPGAAAGRDEAAWQTAAPPAGWVEAEFDDTGWELVRSAVLPGIRGGEKYSGHGQGESTAVAALYLRAEFNLAEFSVPPVLNLSVQFRGGVVVRINGQEVARAHLPEGPIGTESPAGSYGAAASEVTSRNIAARAKEAVAMRLRTLTAKQVPGALLRPGANLLTVELHRAPGTIESEWATVGLQSLELTPDSGIAPLVAMRPSVRLWNARTLDPILPDDGAADGSASLRPLRIVAPRNGVGSAQVVLSADQRLKGIRATASEFRQASGATIKAEAVLVRFATRESKEMNFTAPYFDALLETPGIATTVQPIWLTVRVPAGAVPGEYSGELKVEASGAEFKVPVHLAVAAWKIPAPRDWHTFTSFLQSPESVAWQYGVPIWSEQHFRLLGQSFGFMGELGGRTLTVPVLDQTHLWTEHAMIPLRRTAEGFVPEFGLFDRYLDLYQQHVGEPTRLVLYVWDMELNTIEAGRADEIVLTEILPDGKLIPVTLPIYGEPASRALWLSIMEGVRQRVKQRGWDERCVTIGVASDGRPDRQTVNFFKGIAPYAQWSIFTHGRGDPRPKNRRLILNGGMSVGWEELVKVSDRDQSEYQPGSRARDAGLADWNDPENRYGFLLTWSTRFYMFEYSDPEMWRAMADAVVQPGIAGFSRYGLDYWPVRRPGENSVERVLVNDEWNLDNPRSILAPGPTGAVGTVRFEMLREGLQEAEARIALELAAQRGALPPATAEQFNRLQADRRHFRSFGASGNRWTIGPMAQEQGAALYALAAQIEGGAATK